MQPVIRTRGFTLIELMVTVTVLAILLSIGIPSFSDVIRNNRTAAATNSLVTSLNFARSEALKRGMPVTVCPANDAVNPTDCDGNSTGWDKGWLVFSDGTTPVGSFNPGVGGDAIVQATAAPQNQMQITTDVAFVTFSAGGERLNSPPSGPKAELMFEVKNTKCTDKNLRQVNISRIGRISMTKVDCK
jgi:type IV fimbrial biogenesis protein FimT